MKTAMPILLIGLLAVFAKAAGSDDQLPPPPEGKAWKLLWHDEFDGDKLDPSKWEVPEHRRRDGWWSPKAVSLDGKAVALAVQNGHRSIAFPLIGTGSGGFKRERAQAIMLDTLPKSDLPLEVTVVVYRKA